MLRIFDFFAMVSLVLAAKYAVNFDLEYATYAGLTFVGILFLEVLAVEFGLVKAKRR